MRLYEIFHLVTRWNHLHCFRLAVFCFFLTVEGGERLHLGSCKHQLTVWHELWQQAKRPIQHRCSWAQKANMIRSESWSHANQGQSDTCGGTDTLLPEMFLSFKYSWYQPLRNASSPANVALNCKTNIQIRAGEESFQPACCIGWINPLWFEFDSSLFSTETALFDDTGSPFIGDVKYQYEVRSTVMTPWGGRRFSEWRHNKLPVIKTSGSCSLLLTNASLLLSEQS